jgi:hypothetical protein
MTTVMNVGQIDQYAQCIVVASMTTLMNVGQKTHAMAIITIPIDAISAIWFTVLWIIVGLLHGRPSGLSYFGVCTTITTVPHCSHR